MAKGLVPLYCYGVLGGLWFLLFIGAIANRQWLEPALPFWLGVLLSQLCCFLTFVLGLAILRWLLGPWLFRECQPTVGTWLWWAYVIRFAIGGPSVLIGEPLPLAMGLFTLFVGAAALWCYLPVVIAHGAAEPLGWRSLKWPLLLEGLWFGIWLIRVGKEFDPATFAVAAGCVLLMPAYVYTLQRYARLFSAPDRPPAPEHYQGWKVVLFALPLPWCLYCAFAFMVLF